MLELNPLVGLAILATVIVGSLGIGIAVGHSQGLIKGLGASEKVLEQFNQNETLQTLAHGATKNVDPALFQQALNIIALGKNATATIPMPTDAKEVLTEFLGELRDAIYNLRDPNTPPPPREGDNIPSFKNASA